MKRTHDESYSRIRKKVRVSLDQIKGQNEPLTQYSTLHSYYQQVCTLGDVLVDWLPLSSRVRRRRLRHFDVDFPQHTGLLNNIVVGCSTRPSPDLQRSRKQEFVVFTQTQRSAHGHSDLQVACNIADVVDFAIWTLFQRCSSTARTPAHVLCHGWQRAASLDARNGQDLGLELPGIVQRVRNANVEAFKRAPWTDIANLLGRDAETILLSLFLDCGLFQKLETGKHNLYQLSGEPITRLTTYPDLELRHTRQLDVVAKPASITFVRNRMFHGKPSLNGQGKVKFGLKHIHALNRYNDLKDPHQDLRIMQYVFPRQFGLHNVFTSVPDPNETTQLQKDYTTREHEIAQVQKGRVEKVPRRLRGAALVLVRKLRRNHEHCSYTQLLQHYCPINVPSTSPSKPQRNGSPVSNTPPDQMVTQLNVLSANTPSHGPALPTHVTSFLDHATPASHVVSFCQAVVIRLLPRNILGVGEDGIHNLKHLLASIDQFVRMRRFESITLHEVHQHMKIKTIDWLRTPSIQNTSSMSLSDRAKRADILMELVYYVFDSLLIPLVRSHFYVTETGVHRYRLYYFRHDVWKKMVEPNLALMRLRMFEPLKSRQTKQNIGTNNLACGHMRLLPKEHGVRAIVNLKRRSTRVVDGKHVLGSSVNTQLAPIFSILNFERCRQPEVLASAMFSVSEIQDKLSKFKARLDWPAQTSFYLVKVDITSCFDTIPQDELLQFIDSVLMESKYQVSKHIEVKCISAIHSLRSDRATSRYISRAMPTEDNPLLSLRRAAQLASKKQRHVFIGTDQEKVVKLELVRKLLYDHLKNNTVRIGRKHFRQVQGIPQGSVLSSLLCNLFYGDFERQELQFLEPNTSLLLRLIDDFLLITTSEAQARQFVMAMSCGSSKYGISVNAEKSLVNFEVSISGHKIPRVNGTSAFPYCGMTIDTRDLHLRKDRRPKDLYVQNGLTVGHGGKVVGVLQHRIVFSLKRQLQAMILDGSLNTRTQVMRSVFECFLETGMKLHQYLRSLSKRRRPDEAVLVRLCIRLTNVGFKAFRRARVHAPVQLSQSHMIWLATAALSKVFSRKQSEYRGLLERLREVEVGARKSMNLTGQNLTNLAEQSARPFVDYVY